MSYNLGDIIMPNYFWPSRNKMMLSKSVQSSHKIYSLIFPNAFCPGNISCKHTQIKKEFEFQNQLMIKVHNQKIKMKAQILC